MQRNIGFPISISVLIVIAFVFVFMGCVKKPVDKLSVDKPQAAEQEMAARQHAEAEAAQTGLAGDRAKATGAKTGAGGKARYKGALKTVYVVKKGDSLWWIAKYKDIYNDPYLWPVIHDANNKAIKDPNRIYPGMKLQIPREGYTPADIRNAREKAGARKPYNPPARAVPPVE
jgi:LysM repeat protein